MTLETIEATEILVDMTKDEAKQAVDDIKRGINTVRARIYDLDRRKGWKALGYRSFAACCMEEFPELHARTIQKQLAAAQVEASLKKLRPDGRSFQVGNTPEAHLRPLVSVKNDDETLVAAYSKAQDIAKEENGGKLTEAIVTRAVEAVKPEYEWTEDELDRRAIVEAGGTVVANLHQDTDRALLAWARKTERFERIDRNSEWGNPFELGPDGDRDTVCDSYEIYFGRKYSLHERVQGIWYPDFRVMIKGHRLVDGKRRNFEKSMVAWDVYEALRGGKVNPFQSIYGYKNPYLIVGNLATRRNAFIVIGVLSAPDNAIAQCAIAQQLSFV